MNLIEITFKDKYSLPMPEAEKMALSSYYRREANRAFDKAETEFAKDNKHTNKDDLEDLDLALEMPY
jgi:hypothetical protein